MICRIYILLFCCLIAQSVSSQSQEQIEQDLKMTVKDIFVSQDQPYTDHISLEGDVTDKDIMVKFVFDEAANQLTVNLISHRMIFVFREDVRFKPLIKGRKIRPDQLPYVVTFDPTDKYKISKFFKATVPKPRKQYVFHRWVDYKGLQPAPQEYSMVNDYISQTFDIQKKASSVVVQLRDVMLMNDISKHINKRVYEIPFGRDLYTEYRITILRNPCFGLEEDVASAKAAFDAISKGYKNLKKKFGNGVVYNEESLTIFNELKEALQKQYTRKEGQSPCSDMQEAWDSYNTYVDSIASMTCRLEVPVDPKGRIGDGVSDKMLLAKAHQIDVAVANWLLSSDPVERRDIIQNVGSIIEKVNEEVSSMGVYTAEQRSALAVFREAERYYKNNCLDR